MMKKLLLIILSGCVCLLSCKKETVSAGLFGKWELRRMSGSIIGFDSTYAVGNGRIIQFASDSTFKQYNKGKLINQGTFRVTKAASQLGVSNTLIEFNNNGFSNYMNLNGTQLSIGQDFDDGVASDYAKISN